MNNQVFIPSYGLGEIYLDIEDDRWYMHDSSCFDYQEEIPFFKLLFDMASLRMRCYTRINNNCFSFRRLCLIVEELVYICLRALLKLEVWAKIFFVLETLKRLIIAWKHTGVMLMKNLLIITFSWSGNCF